MYRWSNSTTPNSAHQPGNYVYDNGDAGSAKMASFTADASDNNFESSKDGVNFSGGCVGNGRFYNVYNGSAK